MIIITILTPLDLDLLILLFPMPKSSISLSKRINDTNLPDHVDVINFKMKDVDRKRKDVIFGRCPWNPLKEQEVLQRSKPGTINKASGKVFDYHTYLRKPLYKSCFHHKIVKVRDIH